MLPRNYLVLPGFVDSPQALALKSEMDSRGLVMSMHYSRKCKLFVFPKEFVQSQWLEELNIIVVRQPHSKVELLFFIVLKLLIDDDSPRIEPHSMTLQENARPFLLKKVVNDIVEKPLEGNRKQSSEYIQLSKNAKKTANGVGKSTAESGKRSGTNATGGDSSQVKASSKRMNIEDVHLELDIVHIKPKNKLNELLRGSLGLTSSKKVAAGDVHSTRYETHQKTNLKNQDELGLMVTPQAGSHGIEGHNGDIEGQSHFDNSFQRVFEKNLNSDQKLFVDKYDNFGINIGEPGVRDAEIAFQPDENLHFSDEGNIVDVNSYGQRGQLFFDMSTDPQLYQGDYAHSYNNLLDQKTNSVGQSSKEYNPLPSQPQRDSYPSLYDSSGDKRMNGATRGYQNNIEPAKRSIGGRPVH